MEVIALFIIAGKRIDIWIFILKMFQIPVYIQLDIWTNTYKPFLEIILLASDQKLGKQSQHLFCNVVIYNYKMLPTHN